MAYRIYYQKGSYDYQHSDHRSMSYEYSRTVEYLEAQTAEDLQLAVRDLIEKHARRAAHYASKEVTEDTDKIPEVEHGTLRFVSPIVQIALDPSPDIFGSQEELLEQIFEQKYYDYMKEAISNKFEHERMEKVAREREEEAERLRQEELKQDPDYQSYLRLKTKFE